MKRAKHYLRVFIVDDDEVAQRQFTELINEVYPSAEVHSCESIAHAMKGMYAPDVLLIDVSCVAPAMLSDVVHAYKPIAWYLNQYPRCTAVIHSAMSRDGVYEVIEDVNNACGEPRAVYGGWGDWEGVKRAIDKIISEKGVDV